MHRRVVTQWHYLYLFNGSNIHICIEIWTQMGVPIVYLKKRLNMNPTIMPPETQENGGKNPEVEMPAMSAWSSSSISATSL